MRPVYVAGRALACGRGLSLAQSCNSLRGASPAPVPVRYELPEQGSTPYWRIPDVNASDSWDTRARTLVTQVVQQAGATHARHGPLFVATSSLDGECAQHSERPMDFHALAHRIGDWLQWEGPVVMVTGACTSSMQALLGAYEWLRSGLCTEAVVLGLELDNHLTLPGFAALQLLSPSASQPFAAQRDGLVLGEAVAALRLSTNESAPWVLRGGAHVVDGNQPTSASADAVAQMCQRAFAASGVQSIDIDLIKVQAAGSPGNDAAEAQGLRIAFDHVPALVSLKPVIGHCMGASGAAELALLLEMLEHGCWPPVGAPADPSLGVHMALRAPPRVRHLLAAILGFGGSHAAVVLEHRQP